MYYGTIGLGMILFWALFIWLIIWLVKQNEVTKENPLDIIKRRYAEGKITKKQYEDMKKDII